MLVHCDIDVGASDIAEPHAAPRGVRVVAGEGADAVREGVVEERRGIEFHGGEGPPAMLVGLRQAAKRAKCMRDGIRWCIQPWTGLSRRNADGGLLRSAPFGVLPTIVVRG